jgi:hypothetical protein
MSEFQVVVFNTIAEGFTPEDVERNLSKYLKIDSEKSSELLNREKPILKKRISASDIDKYERVLDKCGISYEIEPIQNVPSSQAPLSMEEQNSEEKNEIKNDEKIMHIEANKISKASLFRLITLGLGYGFFLLFALCGTAALFGAESVYWNGESVTGIMGLVVAILMWPFFSLFFSLFIWLVLICGLWFYSFFGTLKFEFRDVVTKAE